MKGTSRTEFMAIPIVAVILGVLFVLMIASVLGAWAWALVGIAALVLIVLLARAFGKRDRHPAAADAPVVVVPVDKSFRIVVVADESCTTPELSDLVVRHAAGRPTEAYVIAPALGSRLARWTGDETPHEQAQVHLDATVKALSDAGVSASGRVGSADPLQAADDALREFPAHEIVFATHAGNETNWLEDGVVESAKSRYGIPVTHIVVATSS